MLVNHDNCLKDLSWSCNVNNHTIKHNETLMVVVTVNYSNKYINMRLIFRACDTSPSKSMRPVTTRNKNCCLYHQLEIPYRLKLTKTKLDKMWFRIEYLNDTNITSRHCAMSSLRHTSYRMSPSHRPILLQDNLVYYEVHQSKSSHRSSASWVTINRSNSGTVFAYRTNAAVSRIFVKIPTLEPLPLLT